MKFEQSSNSEQKQERNQNPEAAQEGKKGMRFIEGHPVCGECLKDTHSHSTERGERRDCKNTDQMNGKTHQCHCGFGGIYKDSKWQSLEE